jgi:hypothetical protein
MTLPPTIARELRATARRRSTYWGRALLAALGVGACLFLFKQDALALAPARVGHAVFLVTSLIGAGYAAAAFLVTADCISSERREGTLGLLFLTDLKTREVLLGKLAVRGFGSFYLMLGLTPALMLSLVAGGVMASEVVRIVLTLLNLLFLTLIIGLLASVWSWSQSAAIARALGLLTGVGVLPFMVEQLMTRYGALPWSILSPVQGFMLVRDAAYRVNPSAFWLSMAATHLLAWLLLVWASVALSRNWRRSHQPRALKPGPHGHRRLLGPAVVIGRRGSRRVFAPVARALLRMRGLRPLAWLAAVICLFSSFAGIAMLHGLGSLPLASLMITICGLSGHALLAMVAGRFLVEARQSGELELLLVTPVGAHGIAREMRMALVRILLGPFYLIACGGLFAGATNFGFDADRPLTMLLLALTQLTGTILQALAVVWVGMYLGTRAQNLLTLTASAVALAVIAPAVAGATVNLLLQSWGGHLSSAMGGVITVLSYIALILWSGAQLRREFRTRNRSRLDRFFGWCGSSISGSLNRI